MKISSSVSLFFVSAFICFSCTNKTESPFVIPTDAKRLIAGDSVKIWKLAKRLNNGYRMNMGDCFLSYRVSYFTDGIAKDNNGTQQDCGETFTSVWVLVDNEKGSYIKLTSDQVPEFFNTKENYKYFRIIALSENEMVLRFQHQQFSNKKTIITDYLVPEALEIKNRDFHH